MQKLVLWNYRHDLGMGVVHKLPSALAKSPISLSSLVIDTIRHSEAEMFDRVLAPGCLRALALSNQHGVRELSAIRTLFGTGFVRNLISVSADIAFDGRFGQCVRV